MIQISNVEVVGWEAAIRGMRNPLNSWDKSDSCICDAELIGDCPMILNGYEPAFSCDNGERKYCIGEADIKLMANLANAGSDHAKYRRMITVYADVNAALYWWKEYDTYKVGTVANSCSTMHKIHAKEFTMEDFSTDKLNDDSKSLLEAVIYGNNGLNWNRAKYLETKDKTYWWQMIQLLPSSYNQKRTVQLNYEVLANMYHSRKNHKLDEWRQFCTFIEQLPYSELITGGVS